MQLTRFDRWLREKFVYETHIYTLRPPESVPAGIRVKDLPEEPGKRYKHLFVARTAKAADSLISRLRENNQMFATRIVDRDLWYVSLIAPKEKSVTWWLVTAVAIAIAAVFVIRYVMTLADNPAFRKNFLEAIEIMKG